MSKQTRRSVSISGELYAALQNRCAKTSQTISGVVELYMRQYVGLEKNSKARQFLDKTYEASKTEKKAPEYTRPPQDPPTKPEKRNSGGNIFTF
jgi:hypothetical protein